MEFILYHGIGSLVVLVFGGYLGWQTRGHNEQLARDTAAKAEQAAKAFAAQVKAEVDRALGKTS